MIITYFLLALALSIGISMVVNRLILSFARTLGIRNKNDVTVRWSNESKPSLGGVSMFLVFIVSGLLISLLFNEELKIFQSEYLGLLVASSLAFAMGISDDAYDTRPWFKLAIQILCGIIFIISGTTIEFFHHSVLDGGLTILWVIILMNSLNMLDNMDGITGTTTLFVLLSCLIIYFINMGFHVSVWSLLIVTCIGTMVGFLRYNVHPSKMFMGDGGSQFIGVIVAFFTVKTLFHANISIGSTIWLGPILALVSLTPAAADTLTVVINRLKAGKSPMVGGKDHTTHHLVYSGKKDHQVGYVFMFLGAASTLMTCLLFLLAKFSTFTTVLIGLGYFLSVFWYLYRNTIKFKQKA